MTTSATLSRSTPSMVNMARIIGPAIAGLLIATVGEGVCFLLNAASFAAVVASLLTLDRSALSPVTPEPRARGQLRAGLRYVATTPELAVPLLMMAAVGCLAYEFQVSLPYMASRGLHAGPGGYGLMVAAMGVGAVIGGLIVATRGKIGSMRLVLSAAVFGVSLAIAALAPNLAVSLIGLVIVGGASVTFMSTGNATLQLRSAPEMRGRVMALWFVAFQGSTPIGGPIVGFVMAALGPRAGLGLGAITCLIVAAGGAFYIFRRRRRLASSMSSRKEQIACSLQPVGGSAVQRPAGAAGPRRDDPPRLRGVVGEGERPPLGEVRLACRVAGEYPGRVPVLDVTAAAEVDVDRHRRRLGVGVEAGDADLLQSRATDDESRLLARIAGMQQFTRGRGGSDGKELIVGAVDRLHPSRYRPAGGDLEDVGREAPVRDAQIVRRRAGITGELELGDLAHLGAIGHGGRDGTLDERLVAELLLVAPFGCDDLIL